MILRNHGAAGAASAEIFRLSHDPLIFFDPIILSLVHAETTLTVVIRAFFFFTKSFTPR